MKMLFTDAFLTERRNNFMDQIGEFWYYIESTDDTQPGSGWLKCTEISRAVSGYYISFMLELPQVLSYNHRITMFRLYRAKTPGKVESENTNNDSAVPVEDPKESSNFDADDELIGSYSTEYTINSGQTLEVIFRVCYQENQTEVMSNVIR